LSHQRHSGFGEYVSIQLHASAAIAQPWRGSDWKTKELTTDYRTTSAWNGNEEAGGTAFSVSLSSDAGSPTRVVDDEFIDVAAESLRWRPYSLKRRAAPLLVPWFKLSGR
jgi:hypothetical protein